MIAAAPFTTALAQVAAPDWLAPSRRASLDRFLAAGLPGQRLEEWKYTSLGHLEAADLHAPAADGSEAVCPDVTAYPGHVLAFQDGQLACHGTYLSSQLAGTLRHFADTRCVRECLGQVAAQSALVDLNHALWRDGARIYIPAGDAIAVPIFAVFSAAEADAMLYPRVLAVLEGGARAVLVEHYLGETAATRWQNAVTEIVLGPAAALTHIVLIEEGAAATFTGHTAVRLDADSDYRLLHVAIGGALARHDVVARLEGEGARVRADAFSLADGRQQRDLHLRVDHLVPGGLSRVRYRSLADGRGRNVFDGRVIVHPGAQHSDARQSCRSLLLSPHAEVDAKPQLEIHADDVKCSHGATVGRLDEEALFYLRSRGIDHAEARRLLMQAFAAEVLGLAEDSGLKDWLLPRLLRRLPAAVPPEVRQ